MSPHRLPTVALLLSALAASPVAQDWTVLDPSNTGIPGEEVRFTRWAPDGELWVGARWPFWGEGGIGRYDRTSEVWSVESSLDTPLPTPFVNDVEFALDGSAWIATGKGLVHLVGETFTVWDASNSPMQLDVVKNLSIAPDGHIWLNSSSSSSGGDAIYEFDGVSNWRAFSVPAQIPFAAPWTDLENVLVTSDGHVWVANTTLDGVAEFDGSTWTLHGAGVTRFDSMAEDSAGNLWLASNLVGGAHAFYRFDGTSFTTYPLSSPTVVATDPDSGAIYAGSWQGVVLRSTNGGLTFETFASGLNIVFDIAPDPTGSDVIVGTIGAVGRFSASGQLLQDWNTYNTGLPWYWVDGFAKDRNGHFWLATGEGGLSRFDGKRWRNWGTHNLGAEPYPFAGNDRVAGAFQDASGTFWFGGNGIARWDESTGQFTGFWNWQNNPLIGVTMFPHFAQDADGIVYASTENGATYHFDESQQLWIKEDVFAYAPLGLPGMLSDSQGDVWLVGWFDIFHRTGGVWQKIALPYNDYFFDMGGMNDVAIDAEDALWIGTNDGLVRYDGTGFLHLDGSSVPIPGAFVQRLDIRADGLMALTATGSGVSQPSGVAIIDGDPSVPANWTIHAYGSTPIPHWQLTECAFDAQGDLWVSALSQGVAVLDIGAWDDVGSSLDGTHGAPFLIGSGALAADTDVGLLLTDAREDTTAALVLGLSMIGAAFKGGVLVPSPDVVVAGLPTGPDGRIQIATTWPSGIPAGVQLAVQWWISDPAGPLGFAASNGVLGETP